MHETAKLDSFAIDFAFQRILEAKIFEQGQKKNFQFAREPASIWRSRGFDEPYSLRDNPRSKMFKKNYN
jgi:hypothetical protein